MKDITIREVRSMLDTVLRRAERLGLTDGRTHHVSIQRGVSGWIVSDPDSVVSSFLPVSKGIGATKNEAWRALLCIREVLMAVAVKHPGLDQDRDFFELEPPQVISVCGDCGGTTVWTGMPPKTWTCPTCQKVQVRS